jgi:hypothetical protein
MAAIIALTVASTVNAQMNPAETAKLVDMKVVCDDAKKMFSAITQNYKEMPTLMALDQENKVEYYVTLNPEKSTWTIIGVSTQNSMACLIASGQGLKVQIPSVKKDDSI